MGALIGFAVRDLARRPARTALHGAALAALVAVIGTPLLVFRGAEATARAALSDGPTLVVRRVGPLGAVLPVDGEAGAAALRAIRGVATVRPRRWGTAGATVGAVTVVGADAEAASRLRRAGVRPPEPGEAVRGEGLGGAVVDGRLALAGSTTGPARVFRVVGTVAGGAVAHDVVVLTWADAGGVLGLDAGQASDLAVWLTNEGEEQTLAPELAAALPHAARVVGRGEATRATLAVLGRRSGLAIALVAPAALAMVFLVVATGVGRRDDRHDVAVLLLSGWTARDVAALRALEAAALALPALLLGSAVAWALAIWPGAPPVVGAILDWPGVAPRLDLDPAGALESLAVVLGLVGAPWLGASLLVAGRATAVDPAELLDG